MPEVRRAYWRGRVMERRQLLYLAVGGILTFGIVHYVTHINETPVTHRRRYLAFTKEQFMKLAEFLYTTEFEKLQDHIVPPTHPVYERVAKVVKKVVDSNQDLEFMREQTWTILVVDSEDVNAFVMPMGQIFVTTAVLSLTETDSQLAVVLSHEISHALLSHGAEQVSFAAVLDVLIIIIMAAVWAFMPTDGIAIVTQWFYNKVIEILLHLPYSRRLEEEADEVGLQLMAKACYDVRESSAFWQKMALHSQLEEESDNDSPQWLSTHPNPESRAKKLDDMIPAAEALRLDCSCPHLKTRDPRSALTYLQQLVAEKDAAKKSDSTSSRTSSNVTVTAPRDPVPLPLTKS